MPDVPDYYGLANQQYAQNVDLLNRQTQANRPNQYNPYGSSVWSNNNGTWTNTVTLSPEQQALFDKQQGLMGGLMSKFQANTQNMDPSSITADAAIKAIMDRMRPELNRTGSALQSRLAAQGLTQGSEAYNNAYDVFNRQVNDANLGAIINGTQQQGQMIDNMLKQINAPLNQMNALSSGAQVQSPTFNGFSNAGSTSAPDYTSAASAQYGQQVGANNANTAKMQGLLSGLGSLAGTYFGGSSGGSVGGALGGLIGGLF